jgi:hypothetical protein
LFFGTMGYSYPVASGNSLPSVTLVAFAY